MKLYVFWDQDEPRFEVATLDLGSSLKMEHQHAKMALKPKYRRILLEGAQGNDLIPSIDAKLG